MADQQLKIFIAVDMDNCLNNFTKQFSEIYSAYYGDIKLDYTRETSPFDLREYLKHLPPEIADQRADHVLSMEHYWDSMELMPNAQEMVELLNEQYNLKILTAPHWPAKNCVQEKINWLNRFFPYIQPNQLIFSQDKGVFHPDSILIDDYPKNLAAWNGKTIKSIWGYNVDYKADKEFMDWSEVPQLVMDILQAW
jgi:5'(3')-deoxyribonucleotidase